MAAPTVNVTCTIKNGATPIQNATVRFQLAAPDIYNGESVNQDVQGTTDANGVVTLAVFPNDLGSMQTLYRVTVSYTGVTTKAMVKVPNRACTLDELYASAPMQPVSFSSADATSAGASATAAAASAAAALSSKNAAATSETNAGTSASNAAASLASMNKGGVSGTCGLTAEKKVDHENLSLMKMMFWNP